MNPRDAIMTLVESVERTYEDDVPEREATAIAAVVKLLRWSGFPDMSRNTAARGRKVEVLLFARHTRKWEFAKQEWNEAQLKWQWIRSRDGGSYICKVGEEIAIMDVPPPPALD